MRRDFGLHHLPTAELKRLLRALHREALPAPITRAALIEKAFGHIEAHLDLLIGRDLAAAKALVIAVLAARDGASGGGARLIYSGPPAPGTRSRDLFEQVHELLLSTTKRAQLYGLRTGDDPALLRAVNGLLLGRDVQVRLVFDGADLAEPSERVRELVSATVRTRTGLELFVSVGARLRGRAVVVDDERVLVTSGELSGREQDGFIDVGALLTDSGYARALGEEWDRLVTIGACLPIAL